MRTDLRTKRPWGALGLVLFIAGAMSCLASTLHGQSADRQWPDINSPGPDLGDFPNSAFTIPAGTWQVEFAPFSILGEDKFAQPQYFTQFLLRFGLTDDVEFRIFGNGFTAIYAPPETTGFSPIVLDSKIHLWDAQREVWLPAMSLEVALTTDWGSPAFSSGYLPSIYLNFDLPCTEKLNLEWTIGYGEVIGAAQIRIPSGGTQLVDENTNQVTFQWALEQTLTDDLQFFVHGQTLESVAGQSAGTTVGFGGFFQSSDRLMYFSSLNWGVTSDAPKIGAQFGFGIALGTPRSATAAADGE